MLLEWLTHVYLINVLSSFMELEGSSQIDPIPSHFISSHPIPKIRYLQFVIHRPGSPNWFPPPICFCQNYVCLCIFLVLAPFTARLTSFDRITLPFEHY